MIIFNMMGGVQDKTVDLWGHMGGLIVGMLLGYSLAKPIDPATLPVSNPVVSRTESETKLYKRIGLGITGAYFFLGLAFLFLG